MVLLSNNLLESMIGMKATALDRFNESKMRQGDGEVTDVQLIKTLGELEAESTDGFRNPERD